MGHREEKGRQRRDEVLLSNSSSGLSPTLGLLLPGLIDSAPCAVMLSHAVVLPSSGTGVTNSW